MTGRGDLSKTYPKTTEKLYFGESGVSGDTEGWGFVIYAETF